MNITRYLLFSLFFFCNCETIQATSLVVYIRKSHIVFGADSHYKEEHPNGLYRIRKDTKFYQSGEFYYSFSGFSNDDFSTQSIIDECIKSFNVLKLDSRMKFSKHIKTKLNSYLNKLKIENPVLFNKISGPNNQVLNIVVIDYDNDEPIYFDLRLNIANTKSTAINVDVNFINSSQFGDEQYQIFTFGSNKAINQYIKNNPNFIKGLEPFEIVETLINQECIYSPDKVCLPIDLLELSPNSLIWKQKSPNCPIVL